MLLRTRGAVLESAGLRVVIVDSVPPAVGIIRAGTFDVAILCHSLSRGDRLKLTAAIRRRNPSALILLVSGEPGANTAERDGIDAVLEPEPWRLLQRLRSILLPLRKEESGNCSPKAGQA